MDRHKLAKRLYSLNPDLFTLVTEAAHDYTQRSILYANRQGDLNILGLRMSSEQALEEARCREIAAFAELGKMTYHFVMTTLSEGVSKGGAARNLDDWRRKGWAASCDGAPGALQALKAWFPDAAQDEQDAFIEGYAAHLGSATRPEPEWLKP